MAGTIPHNFPDLLSKRLPSYPRPSYPGEEKRPAAVLMPLYKHRRMWHLLFTRRTDTVEEHKGEVAFPGGATDQQDQGPVDTALREIEEEIGLRRLDVTVIGALEELTTVTKWLVKTIVGTIPFPYQFCTNPTEISELFGVPLCWLAHPANLHTEYLRLSGLGPKRSVFFFRAFSGSRHLGGYSHNGDLTP